MRLGGAVVTALAGAVLFVPLRRSTRAGARCAPAKPDARPDPHLDGRLPGAHRSQGEGVRRAPRLVRTAPQPGRAPRHLAARTRCRRTGQSPPLRRPPRSRLVRRRLPGGHRPQARTLLVGRVRAGERPRAHARDPPPHAALAEDRPFAGVRAGRQHGRPGGTPARCTAPSPARRRRGVRRGHGLRPSVPELPAHPVHESVPRALERQDREEPPGAGTRRGRRLPDRRDRSPGRSAARSATPARSRDRVSTSSSGGARRTGSSPTSSTSRVRSTRRSGRSIPVRRCRRSWAGGGTRSSSARRDAFPAPLRPSGCCRPRHARRPACT